MEEKQNADLRVVAGDAVASGQTADAEMARWLETARWLQIHPQESWHREAIIEGNAAALRALAAALLVAADANAAEVNDVHASDGETYSVLIRHTERPDDFRPAFYVIEVQCDNWTAGRCTLARQQQAWLDRQAAQQSAAASEHVEAPPK
jgi:hypothetical protein